MVEQSGALLSQWCQTATKKRIPAPKNPITPVTLVIQLIPVTQETRVLQAIRAIPVIQEILLRRVIPVIPVSLAIQDQQVQLGLRVV